MTTADLVSVVSAGIALVSAAFAVGGAWGKSRQTSSDHETRIQDLEVWKTAVEKDLRAIGRIDERTKWLKRGIRKAS